MGIVTAEGVSLLDQRPSAPYIGTSQEADHEASFDRPWAAGDRRCCLRSLPFLLTGIGRRGIDVAALLAEFSRSAAALVACGATYLVV
jgi:hypothetical protein